MLAQSFPCFRTPLPSNVPADYPVLLIVAALAVSTSALFGGSITVGVNNGGNGFPFGASGTRYQEAYSSSLFSGSDRDNRHRLFLSGAAGTLWGLRPGERDPGTFVLLSVGLLGIAACRLRRALRFRAACVSMRAVRFE